MPRKLPTKSLDKHGSRENYAVGQEQAAPLATGLATQEVNSPRETLNGVTATFAAEELQLALAQRLAAKVAKLLKRRTQIVAEERGALTLMALQAIAAGPLSTARDIAVMALKVVG